MIGSVRLSLALAAPLLLSAAAPGGDESASKIAIEPQRAGLIRMSVGGASYAFPTGEAGFEAYDATARKRVLFSGGAVRRDSDGFVYDGQADGLHLHARFAARKSFVLVTGELQNHNGRDRGILLDYRIPVCSSDAAFCNALDQTEPMAGAEEIEGNLFPIAAMCGSAVGIAMAIPPSEPRIFGMAGGSRGLAIRFYLGLSPAPKRFPNRASFAFLIYPVDPEWGFRSALSKYYDFYPDYYQSRLKRDGLFMFQMGDRTPPNADQYGFDLVEPQSPTLEAALSRDEAHGIASFPYMIVGQREIKFLKVLPQSYEAAMAAYRAWSPADHAGHALTKENEASQGDIHLKEEVESSACKSAGGRYCIVIRTTPWGGNSVTFKMNPNPDLFRGENRPTVARDALELQARWFKEHPEYDGAFVDSLGRNWPATFNYRRDHFADARYPLTLDSEGRVALHNQISHYEYVETLRARMRAAGKLVLANGVYAYKSRSESAPSLQRQTLNKTFNEYAARNAPPEHYRPGARVGRFFCAALLDIASSEAGVRATVERCRDVRAFMGRKLYAFLNYDWEDAAKVEELVNKSLCYDIFASTTTNFFTGVQYENHPNGYLRDKKLLDWFVPLARKLSRAGWRPVRRCFLDKQHVYCERFGEGDVVFFTVYNDSEEEAECSIRFDLAGLGFDRRKASIREIARGVPLVRTGEDGVLLEAAPKRTYVIRIAEPR